jgi:hypothetical protein
MPATTESAEQPRALALDALRGLAILMMCLSGVVPEGLPNWMYHGYYPRFMPDADGVWQKVADPHTFRAGWSSFTWTDWVFPMFLFAMGAAFPLALGRRLDKGASVWRVALAVLGRGIALMAFAVYVQQVTPGTIERPTSAWAWCMGLVGFALLFPVYTRLPRAWGRGRVLAVRSVGIAAAIAFVVHLNTGDGETFSFAEYNIILLLLAHMSIVGSLIWLVTRKRYCLRLGFLGIVYLAHHKAMHGGSMAWLDPVVNLPGKLLDLRWLKDYLPGDIPAGLLDLSVLYNFTWYKFLFVVIPGTIIGDLLRQAMRRDADGLDTPAWSVHRQIGLCVCMLGLIACVLVGLQCHGLVLFSAGSDFDFVTPWATWLGVLPLLLLGWLLVRGGHTDGASDPIAVLLGRAVAVAGPARRAVRGRDHEGAAIDDQLLLCRAGSFHPITGRLHDLDRRAGTAKEPVAAGAQRPEPDACVRRHPKPARAAGDAAAVSAAGRCGAGYR